MVVIDSREGQFLIIHLTLVNPFVLSKYYIVCMVNLYLCSILVGRYLNTFFD